MIVPRHDRAGKAAAWVVAGLALLLVGSLLYRWMGGPPRLVADDGRKAAEAFLAQVRAGRADEAWGGTSAEFKSLIGQEDFRRMVKNSAELKGAAEFLGDERANKDGLSLATFRFKPEKGTREVRVVLAPEGRDWKVERLIVAQP